MSAPIVSRPRMSDGYEPLLTTWSVAGEIRARLLILHGVQSHAGWYENLGQTLASRGFEARLPDRRGSGANAVDRGHTPSCQRLVDDLVEQLEAARSAGPKRPVGLAGISWGGKLVVAAAAERPDLVDAFALICPGLHPRVDVSRSERLRIAFAYFFNRRRRFPVPLSDPALFTEHSAGQAFIRDDPYALREATAGLLAASRFLDRRVSRARRLVRGPALLMLGGRDRIVDNAATLNYARGMTNAKLDAVEYPEGHHTLEFEPDPNRYANDLADWFDQTLPRT